MAEGKVHLDLRLQDAQAGETIAAFSEEGKETELTELVSRAGARLREKLGAGDIAPNDLAAVKALVDRRPIPWNHPRKWKGDGDLQDFVRPSPRQFGVSFFTLNN
jgi:hypothetical protein